MTSADDDEGIVLGRAGEAQLRLGQCVWESDRSGLRIPLHIVGREVDARAHLDLETWGGHEPTLIAFFASLADEWRGWSGAKTWRDDGAHVWMTATHNGRDLITIRTRIDPFFGGEPGAWELSVDLPIEPGSLDASVVALRELLRQPPTTSK